MYISLICDRSVTTQNLAFLCYWYRKKRFADALLTGIVSQRSLQYSPLECSCVAAALIENYSPSKTFKRFSRKITNFELSHRCQQMSDIFLEQHNWFRTLGWGTYVKLHKRIWFHNCPTTLRTNKWEFIYYVCLFEYQFKRRMGVLSLPWQLFRNSAHAIVTKLLLAPNKTHFLLSVRGLEL